MFYFVVPALSVRFLFWEPLSDYGLAPGVGDGFRRLYVAFAAITLPLVYWMSLTSGFAAKNPVFHLYNGEPYLGSAFLIREMIYFLQFFGPEFFFREFLVHSLRPALGSIQFS